MTQLPKPIAVGDFLRPFKAQIHTGEIFANKDLVGAPAVLTFYLRDGGTGCTQQLLSFKNSHQELQRLGVKLFAVGVEGLESHKGFAESIGVDFPLLSDSQGSLCLGLGIAQREGAGDPHFALTRTTLLVDPAGRVAAIYRGLEPLKHAESVLSDCKRLFFSESPRQIIQQAPVLLIPNVLLPEMRQKLIDVWETQGNEDSGFMRQVDGKTVGVYDYQHKIRRDHFLQAGALREELKQIIGERVIPEIFKAFNYDATRFEDFRIACYDSARGGYFRPHRDNTTSGTAHRRFAMSLLLNDEYEGGFLRFPEFGPHTYRPTAGSAMIFSCSLLHEATDVTAGRRFVLLSFLYGEKEAKLRQKCQQQQAASPAQPAAAEQ